MDREPLGPVGSRGLVGRLGLHTAAADRRAGRVLVGVAALGVVVALLGTVVAWQLVGDLGRASRTSIEVTLESLDSVQDTVELADSVLRTTTATLTEVERTLETVASSFGVGDDAFEQFDTFTTRAAPTLDDTVAAVRQLASVGASIDALLAQIRSLPFVPAGPPISALGPSFGAVAEGLAPLPDTLRSAADALAELQRSSDQLEDDLRRLSSAVATVNDTLAGTDVLVDGFRRNIEGARAVAMTTRDGLGADTARIRTLLVMGGFAIALGQLAPFWFGTELLARAQRRSAAAAPVTPTPERDRNGRFGRPGQELP